MTESIFHTRHKMYTAYTLPLTLCQIAKHSVDLAELVVEAELFPAVFPNLKGALKNGCEIRTHMIHLQYIMAGGYIIVTAENYNSLQ